MIKAANISRSFPTGTHVNDKEYLFADIVLTPCKSKSEICGKVDISQKSLDRTKPPSKEALLHHHALVVELHADITVTNSDGQKDVHSIPGLLAGPESDLICNSTIFAIISGSENGIKKAEVTSESIIAQNPVSFSFKIELPQTQQQLPATLESSMISVDYFLVLYIRTDNGYEELERRPLQKFKGHNLIPFGEASVCTPLDGRISSSTNKLSLSSQQKFYVLKQPIIYNIALESSGDSGESREIVVELLQRILFNGSNIDDIVLDCKNFKSTKGSMACKFNGKFAEGRKELMPTYNSDNHEGLQILLFLKCELKIPESISLEVSEELIIGTGILIPPGSSGSTTGQSFFSRLRSQSIASVRSLFPPTYSSLFNREGSQVSVETLPPNYNDAKNE